jgi:hypothetical protein
MPRTGRGGTRIGAPGAAYGNRTDLAGKGPVRGGRLDLSAAPNQPYGQAGGQIDAQRAIPMGTPALPGPAGGTPPTPGPAAVPPPQPGQLPSLTAPTGRPQEPVTAGMASGPGAGPEAVQVGPAPQAQPGTVKDTLVRLAAQPGAPQAVQQLASLAQGFR